MRQHLLLVSSDVVVVPDARDALSKHAITLTPEVAWLFSGSSRSARLSLMTS